MIRGVASGLPDMRYSATSLILLSRAAVWCGAYRRAARYQSVLTAARRNQRRLGPRSSSSPSSKLNR